mmetsp:Transcript_25933/g.56043  ORF Transcript_25933/g.56043 Transcript_25933/m.56043 type:complete len:87 (+) Transcript_25933:78-338(+)
MSDINDWNNPPDKEDTFTPTTTQVAEAASKYYVHLGKFPVRTTQNKADTDILLSHLSAWGVETATPDKTGRDISQKKQKKARPISL